MRALAVLLSVVPAIAFADNTADRDLLVEYRRLAVEAARTGNCDPARELAVQVKSIDPAFFANEYATDPSIAPCLPPPASPAAIAPVVAPAPWNPPPASEPVDTPRNPAPTLLVPDRPAVPPVEPERLVGQVLVGGLVATGGVLVGALVGLAAFCQQSGEGSDGDECIIPALISTYVGGSVAFGLGGAIAGRAGSQTGSTGAAVGGALLGSVLGLAALVGLGDGDNARLSVTILLASPAIGALIGFNVTRRWKHQTPIIGSLLRFDRGRASLGIPFVTHGEQRGIATTSVPLLSGSF